MWWVLFPISFAVVRGVGFFFAGPIPTLRLAPSRSLNGESDRDAFRPLFYSAGSGFVPVCVARPFDISATAPHAGLLR